MKARFRIENVHSAEPALQPSFIFSDKGGSIGSGAESTWRIQDTAGQVPVLAALVAVVDRRFTLEALGSIEIRLNGANSGIPRGRPVILNDNDTLALGNLRITAHVSDALSVQDGQGLSGLVEPRQAGSDSFVIDGEFAEAVPFFASAKPPVDDPLAALDKAAAASSAGVGMAYRADAFEALGAIHPAMETNVPPVGTIQSDSRIEANSAVSFQKAPSFLFDSEPDGFEGELVDHVASEPLARALGLPAQQFDALESDEMVSEVGAALRAAVEGLNKLFLMRAGKQSRFPLAAMHLHLVEDNPLRSATTGPEAMEALFAKRGAIQLSASSAIRESLENLKQHEDAAEIAADRALAAVSAAMKPEALERRFATYSRNPSPSGGPDYDAWCWQMYRAFHAGLASHRQDGLQVLFWEVFACEYQAAMRSLVNGSDKSAETEE